MGKMIHRATLNGRTFTRESARTYTHFAAAIDDSGAAGYGEGAVLSHAWSQTAKGAAAAAAKLVAGWARDTGITVRGVVVSVGGCQACADLPVCAVLKCNHAF